MLQAATSVSVGGGNRSRVRRASHNAVFQFPDLQVGWIGLSQAGLPASRQSLKSASCIPFTRACSSRGRHARGQAEAGSTCESSAASWALTSQMAPQNHMTKPRFRGVERCAPPTVGEQAPRHLLRARISASARPRAWKPGATIPSIHTSYQAFNRIHLEHASPPTCN